MNTQELEAAWHAYMSRAISTSTGANGYPFSSTGQYALLFGNETVNIDAANHAAMIDGLPGRIRTDIASGDYDWYALLYNDGDPILIAGHGSPFDDANANLFPSHAGLIYTMPVSVHMRTLHEFNQGMF